MLEDGRDPRRRRDRPRHRVVPQRPLGRLQDGRGHRSRAARAVPAARGRARARSASRCGRWSSSRPTTRSPSAAAVAAADDRGSSRSSSARPTRTSASASAATVVQLDRRKRRSCSTPTACARSSACRRRRSPTGSRSSATAPTASPACPGWGAKTAAAVLARYGHLEAIPDDADGVGRAGVRGVDRARGDARRAAATSPTLFKVLATLRTDADVGDRRRLATGPGPTPSFAAWCERFGCAETRRRGPRSSPKREEIGDDRDATRCSSSRSGRGIAQITLNRPERLQRDEPRPRRAACTTRSTSSRADRDAAA